MIVKARSHDLSCERLPQRRQIRPGSGAELDDNQARNREILQGKTRAKPGFDQPCGFFLGVNPHFGGADRRAREVGCLAQIRLDVASGCRANLNSDLTTYFRLPVACRVEHNHPGAGRQRGEEGHDSDNGSQRAPGDRVLGYDRRYRRHGAHKSGRRVQVVPRLRHGFDRLNHRHAGVPHAEPVGARRTRPSAQCRG